MKYKNICKFIENGDMRDFFTKRFVCERTPAAMRKTLTMSMYRAALFTESAGQCRVNELCVDVKKGDLLFLFKGDTFSVEPQDRCEYFYIDFDGSRCEQLLRRFCIGEKSRMCDGHEGLIPFWRDAIAKASDSNLDLIAESVLLYSFADLGEIAIEKDSAAMRAAQIVDDEFSDAKLSLKTVAELLGYNQKYLSHSFKQTLGVGFSEYLRTVRIRHAVFLMEHGLESVKNISYLCGFEDPLYFSSVFKKVIGLPPAAYLKRIKDKIAQGYE